LRVPGTVNIKVGRKGTSVNRWFRISSYAYLFRLHALVRGTQRRLTPDEIGYFDSNRSFSTEDFIDPYLHTLGQNQLICPSFNMLFDWNLMFIGLYYFEMFRLMKLLYVYSWLVHVTLGSKRKVQGVERRLDFQDSG